MNRCERQKVRKAKQAVLSAVKAARDQEKETLGYAAAVDGLKAWAKDRQKDTTEMDAACLWLSGTMSDAIKAVSSVLSRLDALSGSLSTLTSLPDTSEVRRMAESVAEERDRVVVERDEARRSLAPLRRQLAESEAARKMAKPTPPEWLRRAARERRVMLAKGHRLTKDEVVYLAGIGVRALEWAEDFLGMERVPLAPADTQAPPADPGGLETADVLADMKAHDAMEDLAAEVRRFDGQPIERDADGLVSGEPLDLSHLTEEEKAALPRLDPDASNDPAGWTEAP